MEEGVVEVAVAPWLGYEGACMLVLWVILSEDHDVHASVHRILLDCEVENVVRRTDVFPSE